MAKLPPITRITKEDFKDAPPWVDRLLYPLNLFLSGAYSAFNNGITVDENMVSQVKIFQLIGSATAASNTIKFPLTMKAKPRFFLLTAVPTTGDSFAPVFTWNYDGTNINITSITGLTGSVTYNFTALLL